MANAKMWPVHFCCSDFWSVLVVTYLDDSPSFVVKIRDDYNELSLNGETGEASVVSDQKHIMTWSS